ncbi:MAG: hypothetical protein AAB425_14725, partial [Bdellovibrionota bacterium]
MNGGPLDLKKLRMDATPGVEFAALRIKLCGRDEWVTAFYTSSDPASLDLDSFHKALGGALAQTPDARLRDVDQLQWFHTHPAPGPLSRSDFHAMDATWDFFNTKGRRTDVEFFAITETDGQPWLFRSFQRRKEELPRIEELAEGLNAEDKVNRSAIGKRTKLGVESNLAEAKREVVEFESEAGRQFARVRSDRASAAYLALFKPAAKRRTLDSQWRDWRRKTLELFRESSVLEYLPPDLLRESARFLSKRDLPNPRDFVYTLASISDDETSFDLLRRWIRAHKGGDFKMDLEALKAMNVFPKTKDPDSRIGFGRTRICGNSSCHDFASIEDIEWQNLGAADGRLRILTPRWSADSAIYPYEQFSESIAHLPPEI